MNNLTYNNITPKEKKKSGKTFNFPIGQKVFHPFYGVGTVVNRNDNRDSSMTSDDLSTIKFNTRNLQIMTRLNKDSMIKKLSSSEEVYSLIEFIKKTTEDFMKDYPLRGTKRYGFALEKMKNGDISNVAEVIRDLSQFNKIKKITTKERELLQSAKDVFCEAICEIEEIDMEEAKVILNKAL